MLEVPEITSSALKIRNGSATRRTSSVTRKKSETWDDHPVELNGKKIPTPPVRVRDKIIDVESLTPIQSPKPIRGSPESSSPKSSTSSPETKHRNPKNRTTELVGDPKKSLKLQFRDITPVAEFDQEGLTDEWKSPETGDPKILENALESERDLEDEPLKSESESSDSIVGTPIQLVNKVVPKSPTLYITPVKKRFLNENFKIRTSIFINKIELSFKNFDRFTIRSPKIDEITPITVIKGDIPLPRELSNTGRRRTIESPMARETKYSSKRSHEHKGSRETSKRSKRSNRRKHDSDLEESSSDSEMDLYVPLKSKFESQKPTGAEMDVVKLEEEWIEIVHDFKLFKQKFPDLEIEMPKQSDPRYIVRQRRDLYKKKIAINTKVKEYQIWIVLGSFGLEFLSWYLGVDAEDFTESQLKLMSIYEKDLEKMCQSNYGGVFDDYSPQWKILFTMIAYYLIIIFVKFMLSKMPCEKLAGPLKDTILYAMRQNMTGDTKTGPNGETSPIANLISEVAGYFPIVAQFMGGARKVENLKEPICDE